MKIKYFEDTDTLYIEFSQVKAVERKDLVRNTMVDPDSGGNICAGSSAGSRRLSISSAFLDPKAAAG